MKGGENWLYSIARPSLVNSLIFAFGSATRKSLIKNVRFLTWNCVISDKSDSALDILVSQVPPNSGTLNHRRFGGERQ